MSEEMKWSFEPDEYIRQGEPDQAEKSEAWKIAIGLQQVDGLETSAYLLDTAKEHIEGKINIREAQERVENYYKVQLLHFELHFRGSRNKEKEYSTRELMELLELKHRPSFRDNYLLPALKLGYIEMTIPNKPNSSKQKYKKSKR